jgi:hypothetical protein
MDLLDAGGFSRLQYWDAIRRYLELRQANTAVIY